MIFNIYLRLILYAAVVIFLFGCSGAQNVCNKNNGFCYAEIVKTNSFEIKTGQKISTYSEDPFFPTGYCIVSLREGILFFERNRKAFIINSGCSQANVGTRLDAGYLKIFNDIFYCLKYGNDDILRINKHNPKPGRQCDEIDFIEE